MGRRKKQTVDYFPHFVSTDSRTKFILEQRWGNDGYACWFKLLELLGRSEGHYYDCSSAGDMLYLVALMKVSEATLVEIMDTLALNGNIDADLWHGSKIIWCQSLVDNIQDVYNKRSDTIPSKPEAAVHEEPVPEPAPETPKEADEPPEKETRRRRRGTLSAKQEKLFERFWEAYPKKVDVAAAERAWAKIDPEPDDAATEQIIQAIEDAKRFDQRFRDRKYVPNPATWLNAKAYLNKYAEEGERNDERTNEHSTDRYTDPGAFIPSRGFRHGTGDA